MCRHWLWQDGVPCEAAVPTRLGLHRPRHVGNIRNIRLQLSPLPFLREMWGLDFVTTIVLSGDLPAHRCPCSIRALKTRSSAMLSVFKTIIVKQYCKQTLFQFFKATGHGDMVQKRTQMMKRKRRPIMTKKKRNSKMWCGGQAEKQHTAQRTNKLMSFLNTFI